MPNRRRFRIIRSLSIKQSLEVNHFKVMCVHGSPRRVDEDLTPEMADEELNEILNDVEADVVLSGHIHEPYIRQLSDKIIINPGSVGLCNNYGDSRATYAIIEFIDNVKVTFRRLEYNHQEAIDLAKETRMPNIDMFEKLITTTVK